jgi:gluconokinase
VIIVVMGVTGAGKTTVGRLLAQQLEWDFLDADDFHPESNLEKMRRGIALSDADRRPWLERLQAEVTRQNSRGRHLVLACSALKKDYRKMLGTGPAVEFVYLKGGMEQIAERLGARQGHFADDRILARQFADLQEPDDALVIDTAVPPETIVSEIRMKFGI